MGVTCDTPGTASSRRRIVVSASVRSVSGSPSFVDTAKNRISPMIDEIGASTGRSTCGGRLPPTTASFSATSWRAEKMSVPQSNSTHTTAMPTAVADRTRRTPGGAVHGAFDGQGDQRLHLLGCHAVAFGEDGDGGCGEVGEYVDRHLARRPGAGQGQQHRQGHDESRVIDRPLNDAFHGRLSGRGLPRAIPWPRTPVARRRHPRVTTRSPAFTPPRSPTRPPSRTATSTNRRANRSPPLWTNT